MIENNQLFKPISDNVISHNLIEKSLNFLQIITFQNGDIPLVKDSAKNIAPTTKQLTEYANSLNIKESSIKLSESGYRKYTNNNSELFVDVGNITPDYLPAHAHADTLSFVLHINQKPFIVDTGTSTYNNNEIRHKERSTSAHNTVQINDFEQSEMWASFRVGRRAEAIILSENKNHITASHDGYKRLGIIHERTFIANNQKVIIKDRIIGESKYLNKAYLHFHPAIEIQIQDNTLKTNAGNIVIENVFEIEESNYLFSDEFNKGISAKMITLFFYNSITTIIKV